MSLTNSYKYSALTGIISSFYQIEGNLINHTGVLLLSEMDEWLWWIFSALKQIQFTFIPQGWAEWSGSSSQTVRSEELAQGFYKVATVRFKSATIQLHGKSPTTPSPHHPLLSHFICQQMFGLEFGLKTGQLPWLRLGNDIDKHFSIQFASSSDS